MSNTNFPTLISGLSDKRAERFLAAVTEVNTAVAESRISNVRFNDLKSDLNRAIGDTYSALMLKLMSKHGTVSNTIRDIEYDIYSASPALHLIAGKIKKFTAIKHDLPIKTLALTYLKEVLPLAEAMDALKVIALASKRQPKAAEPTAKERYSAPSASKGAIGVVKGLLTEITQSEYDRLVALYTGQNQSWLDRYVAHLNEQQAANKAPLSPHDFFCPTSRRGEPVKPVNFEANSVVNRLVARGPYDRALVGHTYTVLADADALLRAMAIKDADDVRDNFIYKNLAKLDSIVDAKPGLTGGQILDRRVSLAGLTGRLRFTFEDGSAFTVMNQVVHSRSSAGTHFARFPLTFHNVVMAGGVKMAKPCEEKMNTEFVGKVAA